MKEERESMDEERESMDDERESMGEGPLHTTKYRCLCFDEPVHE